MLVRFNIPRSPMRFFSWPMRALTKPWRSLAYLYSAFSERSPWARATAISLGSSTLSSWESWSISSWSFFLILASGSDMVVGFSSLKKSAESGTNRWSPGPRVRKHYRCGGIEVTRGSGGIPQNCPFQAWSTYLWGRDVGIDAAREEALSTFSGLLRRGSGYGCCRQHRRW